MKIKYEFVDGPDVVLDVDEEIGMFIYEDRKHEHALDEQNRYYRRFSLNALVYEGIEVACLFTPESELVYAEEEPVFWEKFHATWDGLTETQKRRITLYADGMNLKEIAETEGVAIKSVHETILQVRKKFRINCGFPPSKTHDFSAYSERRNKFRNQPLGKGDEYEASDVDQCEQRDDAEQRDDLPDTEDQGAHSAVPAGADLPGDDLGSR